MESIGVAKFKEQCLALLNHLKPEGLIITKHGRPVARVIPFGHDSADLIGALRGKIHIQGDLETTGLEWEADGQS